MQSKSSFFQYNVYKSLIKWIDSSIYPFPGNLCIYNAMTKNTQGPDQSLIKCPYRWAYINILGFVSKEKKVNTY